MNRWQRIWQPLLVLAVVVSALAVVYSAHWNRTLFVRLNVLETSRDELNADWGRLQLEQSTYATYGRIEGTAHDKLKMRIPSTESIVVVRP